VSALVVVLVVVLVSLSVITGFGMVSLMLLF
jgi:hypothetical protein